MSAVSGLRGRTLRTHTRTAFSDAILPSPTIRFPSLLQYYFPPEHVEVAGRVSNVHWEGTPSAASSLMVNESVTWRCGMSKPEPVPLALSPPPLCLLRASWTS
jgi:hypothetical protein